MYTTRNFKSKKEIKAAIAAGEKLTIFQPNDMFGNPKASPTFSGSATLEGPHCPQPHKWYATAQIKDGYIVSIK
jgi:hypothetical protein